MSQIHQKSKSVQERAEDAAMMEVLANDYLRTMRINDAPSRAKYFADSAAGDMEKIWGY